MREIIILFFSLILFGLLGSFILLLNSWIILQSFFEFIKKFTLFSSFDYTILFFVIELIFSLLPLIFIVRYYKDPERKPSTLIKIITAYSCILLILVLFNGFGAIAIQKNSVTTFPFDQTNNPREQILTLWSLTNSQSVLNCSQNLTINNAVVCDLNNNTLRITDWITLLIAIIATIGAFIIILEIIRTKASLFSKFMDSDDDDRNKMSYFIYSAILTIVIALIILNFGSIVLIKENWYQFTFLILIIGILFISLIVISELKEKISLDNPYQKIEQINFSYDNNEDNIKIYFKILDQLDFWTFILSGFALVVTISLQFSLLIFFIILICLMFSHFFYNAILNIPYEKYSIFLKVDCVNEDLSNIYIIKTTKDTMTVLTKNNETIVVMKNAISHQKSWNSSLKDNK